ncbi:hypothetical protein AALB47_22860 [Lachnospiraceae bacterium 54-11]
MYYWTSYKEFFDNLNRQEYLILRNYENLLLDIERGDDLDLLCRNKNDFINSIGAVPLQFDGECFNYYVMINEKKILLDIRMVGDGYYDLHWEDEMLKRRIWYNFFYVMDIMDYKYSLLYHAIIHKRTISEQYLDKLSLLFKENIKDRKIRMRCLRQFLKENAYQLSKPVDMGVTVNKRNYRQLYWIMKFGCL